MLYCPTVFFCLLAYWSGYGAFFKWVQWGICLSMGHPLSTFNTVAEADGTHDYYVMNFFFLIESIAALCHMSQLCMLWHPFTPSYDMISQKAVCSVARMLYTAKMRLAEKCIFISMTNHTLIFAVLKLQPQNMP